MYGKLVSRRQFFCFRIGATGEKGSKVFRKHTCHEVHVGIALCVSFGIVFRRAPSLRCANVLIWEEGGETLSPLSGGVIRLLPFLPCICGERASRRRDDGSGPLLLV